MVPRFTSGGRICLLKNQKAVIIARSESDEAIQSGISDWIASLRSQ
jgi:hypothetical protein